MKKIIILLITVLALFSFSAMAQTTWSGTQNLSNGQTVSSDIILSGTVKINVPSGATATISGAISGTGSMVKEGAGTLVLTAPNSTYSGATEIKAGGIRLGAGTTNANLKGTSSVTVNAGTRLTFQPQTTITFTRVIKGAGDVYFWSGTTLLTAQNTLTGKITIQGASLQVGNGAIGSINCDVVMAYSSDKLLFMPGSNYTFSKVITGPGKVAYSGTFNQQLFLTGNNTYTGTTTVEAGYLNIGNNGTTGSLSVYNNINVMSGAHIVFNRSNDYTFSGVISGAGGLIKLGTGNLTLTNENTYTGNTYIKAGKLTLGASGKIEKSSNVSIWTGTKFDITTAPKKIKNIYGGGEVILGTRSLTIGTEGQADGGGNFEGKITGNAFSGYVALVKRGTGTLTLTGSSTYSGDTYIYEGVVVFNKLENFGASFLILGTSTLRWASGNTADISLKIRTFIANKTHTFDVGSNNVTFANTFPGNTNNFSITKAGSGTLTFNAPQSYTGETNINAGNLVINALNGLQSSKVNINSQGTLVFAKSCIYAGQISGAGKVEIAAFSADHVTLSASNNYTGTTTVKSGHLQITGTGSPVSEVILSTSSTFLRFIGSGTITYSGKISGSGYVEKSGNGKTILTGANTYTGLTRVDQGVLQIGNGTSNGNIDNTSHVVLVSTSATLRFEPRTYYTCFKVISGAGKVETKGALYFTANNTYTGTTTIETDGVLSIGSENGTTGSVAGNIINNGKLYFGRSNAYTYSGIISGTGSVYKYGTDNLTLNGVNTYSGITFINSGVLTLGASGSISNSEIQFSPYGGGTFDISAGNKTIKGLQGTHSTAVVQLGSRTLTIGTSGSSNGGGEFRGTFTGTGSVVKNGTAKFTMYGNSTTTGTFTTTAGTVSFSGKWNGNFVQWGANTLEVQGWPTINGNLEIMGGTLSFSSGSKLTVNGEVLPSSRTTVKYNTNATVTGYVLMTAASGITSAESYKLDLTGISGKLGVTSPTTLWVNTTPLDNIPPNPGAGVNGSVIAQTVTLSWSKATDNSTPQNELRYYVYRSLSNNINTVSTCQTNGTLLTSGGMVNMTTFSESNLTPNTIYFYNVIVEDKAGNRAAYTSKAILTQKPTLTGSPTITPYPAISQTLSVDLSDMTSIPEIPNLGTFHYTWMRTQADENTGAPGTNTVTIGTNATYTVQIEDIGSYISVAVLASNCSGNPHSSFYMVPKIDQPAPQTPTLQLRTHNSITLNEVATPYIRYRMNDGEWQTSRTFSGLNPETTYSFQAYYIETPFSNASPVSQATAITTLAEPPIQQIKLAWMATENSEKSFETLINSGQSCIVNWGDGEVEIISPTRNIEAVTVSHTYTTAGHYPVTITGMTSETVFEVFRCDDDDVTDIDVSEAGGLQVLECPNQQLTEIIFDQYSDLYYVDCRNNRLQLSTLYQLSQLIADPQNKLLGTQNLLPKTVMANAWVNMPEQMFFGTSQTPTVFVVTRNGNAAVINVDYQLNASGIKFITAGNFAVTMTNAAIVSHPNHPAIVTATFTVEESIFCGGDGGRATPYEICDAQTLYNFKNWINSGNGNEAEDLNFIITNDIDLSAYPNWEPIGIYNYEDQSMAFQGTLNGNGKVIRNLNINNYRYFDNGFFGYITNATITNLGIENCNIIGQERVGGFAGRIENSSISGCYVSGNVSGGHNAGGFTGFVQDTYFNNCYSTAEVTATSFHAGGFVGVALDYSTFANCYATGNVTARDRVGGFAGVISESFIENCIALNNMVIARNGENVNRLAGVMASGATTNNNYANYDMIVQSNGVNIEVVEGSDAAGVGYSSEQFRNRNIYTSGTFWNHGNPWSMYEPWNPVESAIWDLCDDETFPYLRWQNITCSDHLVIVKAGPNGTAIPLGINGVETGSSMSITFVPDPFYEINDVIVGQVSALSQVVNNTLTIENIQWNQHVNVTFKFNTNNFCGGTGTMNTPYQICDAQSLAALAQMVNTGSLSSNNLFFRVTADIDLSAYPNWEPIGTFEHPFSGLFLGNGHVIKNLSINKPDDNYIGLFGFVESGSISNLGIENYNIKGGSGVGVLAGINKADIMYCYAGGYKEGNECGYITGWGAVGGLVGVNYGNISNCYTSGHVHGADRVGGLVGSNELNSIIQYSLSSTYVTGSYVGGIAGANFEGTIRNCVAANNSVIMYEFMDEVTANRIVGTNTTAQNVQGTLQNNYAWEDMPVVFANEPLTELGFDLNGVNGSGRPAWELLTQTFYTTYENWMWNGWNLQTGTNGIWRICEGETLPFLAWQNNVTCSDYIINAYAHENGTIEPNGTIGVMAGESITFTFTPNPFYVADKVIVGNDTYDANGNTFTLSNINQNYTVQVTFKFSPDLFCGGDGTEQDPYQICSAQTLAMFAQYVNAGNGNHTADKYYILTADINLNAYENWEPIGAFSYEYEKAFKGNFYGNNHVIRNLTINKEDGFMSGLFGYTMFANISNLGVENCNITAGFEIGGLVGHCYSTVVANSYVTGNISGVSNVGGLVGYVGTFSTINSCYANVNIAASFAYAAGLAGVNNGVITNCYAAGNITGEYMVGGLAGYNFYIIQNSVAALETLTGTNEIYAATVNRVAGIAVGENILFSNNYANENMVITVAGETETRPNDELNGNAVSMEWLRTSYFYTNTYNWTQGGAWDFTTPVWNICEQETLPYLAWQNNVNCSDYIVTAYAHENGAIEPNGIIGVMAGESITFTFTPVPFYMADKVIVGNDIYEATGNTFILENINANTTVQVTFKPDAASLFCGGEGTEQSPYEICDAQTLFNLAQFVNAGHGAQTEGVYYILTNNIDLSSYAAGEGWMPIGVWELGTNTVDHNKAFQGNFNGNNHVVQNLTINREHTIAVGLFGYARNANIKNLGVENCNIVAYYQAGGLIGHTEYTIITNCYTTGNISATGQVGGLVGLNDYSSVIANCFTTCDVTGRLFVGGLVGYNLFATTIMNSVAANGTITSLEESEFSRINRIVGWNYFNSELINNYAFEDMAITIAGQPFYPMDNDQNGTAKSMITLQSRDFYTNEENWTTGGAWDFDEVWNICESETLPFFIKQNTPCLGLFTITATSSGPGTISPEGAITVEAGNDITITFTPEENFMVAGIIIDGTIIPQSENLTSYTFTNVQRSHNIEVMFGVKRYLILTNADSEKGWLNLVWQGFEFPTEDIYGWTIGEGADMKFTFGAKEGYQVNQLLIDGMNVPDSIPGGSYTFVNIVADHTIEVTFKSFSDLFCGGDGTAETPYEICDAPTLAALATLVNEGNGNFTSGKYFIVTNQIDLIDYENWEPIGRDVNFDLTKTFRGNFNGDGYVITNLTMNRSDEECVGLFGFINNATIKNLGIENCNVIGQFNVGGLAGFVSGFSTISNCYVTGNVSGMDMIGGLTGQLIGTANIINCYAAANVSGELVVGGLVGVNGLSNIYNCYATGNVTGIDEVGGLVGVSNTFGSIANCYAAGNVTGSYTIGGLVGRNTMGTIQNCVAANDTISSLVSPVNINRIVGNDDSGSGDFYYNNYANGAMRIMFNGNSIVRPNDASLNGTATSPANLKSYSFYANTSNWRNNVAWYIDNAVNSQMIWRICDNATLPFFQWQEGIACPYIIIATAGENGTITPSGDILVNPGADFRFTFTPDAGYVVENVIVGNFHYPDSTAGYTFYNVQENHTIQVYFAPAFVPVTNITGVPTTATATLPLTLTGTVVPGNATNQTIVWSVQNAGTTGATIDGNNGLHTTDAGTVTVRATIANGLTPTTPYTQDFNIAVSKATLTGTPSITGNAVFGEQLTAVTTGLSSTPLVTLGTLMYQWQRGTTNIIGATSATYTLEQADIGQTIRVQVTAANCNGTATSSNTSTVTKATQTAPTAPTMANNTSTSITLNTVTGCEYRRDGGTPQTSTLFGGLTPSTSYNFDQRRAETATHLASPWSTAVPFSTTAPEHIPVTNVTGVPTTATATLPLTLTGTVVPSNATNQTIVWSVQSAGTTGATITGSTLNTTGDGTVTVLATIVNGATPTTPYTQPFNITVTKATLTGTPSITGNAVFGEQLTAVTTGLSSTPLVTLGTLTYQWQRGTTNINGATSATYTLEQADIGQTIRVQVTAANCNGTATSSNTSTVTKATQTAPTAPTMANNTSTSITLNTVTGCEYRRDGGTPQSSTLFSGLTPNTSYSFNQRYAETATHLASPWSTVATFSTEPIPTCDINGKVTFDGNPIAGTVTLYKVQSQSQYILVEEMQMEGNGTYQFIDVQPGNYIIKATPSNLDEALPTYYGNTEMWKDATIINMTNTSIPNIDISMLHGIEIPEGTSSITGFVVEENRKSEKSPVEDVDVYLLAFQNNVWNTIRTTRSDKDGYFAFGKLTAGRYMAIVDIPGLTMLNTIPLDLSENDTINIIFEIMDDGIKTIIAGVGIDENEFTSVKVYSYQNTVYIKNEDNVALKSVEIYDMMGRKIYQNVITDTNMAITLQVADAIYYVRLISQENRMMTSKVSIIK